MLKLRRLSDRMTFYVLFITFYSVVWILCTINIRITPENIICLIILILVQIICTKIQIRSYKLRTLFDTIIEQAYFQSCIILPSNLAKDQVEKLKENIRQDKHFRKIMRSTIW